jgi:beta-glucosidase
MLLTLVSRGLLFIQLCAGLTVAKGSTPLYKDPNAAIEDRVSDLLGRMTLEDKVGQLMQGALICILEMRPQ